MIIGELIIELLFGLIVGTGEVCITGDFYELISNEKIKLSRRKLILGIISVLQVLIAILFTFIVLSSSSLLMKGTFGLLIVLLLFHASIMWKKIIKNKPF